MSQVIKKKSDDPSYNGRKFNVMVDWKDGECTFQPLEILAMDDPITCVVRRDAHFQRMVNQTRLTSAARTMRYKYD